MWCDVCACVYVFVPDVSARALIARQQVCETLPCRVWLLSTLASASHTPNLAPSRVKSPSWSTSTSTSTSTLTSTYQHQCNYIEVRARASQISCPVDLLAELGPVASMLCGHRGDEPRKFGHPARVLHGSRQCSVHREHGLHSLTNPLLPHRRL
jgi:hypothetical protein